MLNLISLARESLLEGMGKLVWKSSLTKKFSIAEDPGALAEIFYCYVFG